MVHNEPGRGTNRDKEVVDESKKGTKVYVRTTTTEDFHIEVDTEKESRRLRT